MSEIKNNIYPIELLLKNYGNIKLSECIKQIKGSKIYLCPACNGVGCDVCKQYGYTEKELKPKMKQNGWE